MDEKVYTINLRDAFEKPRRKRAPKAIDMIRAFIGRHTKVGAENVSVSNKLNAIIWARGIQKPPRKVKVKVVKSGTIAMVYHIDEKIEQPKPADKKGEKKAEGKEEKKDEKKAEARDEKKAEGKKEAAKATGKEERQEKAAKKAETAQKKPAAKKEDKG
jgi:large subunit ribosomal protein L31e